LLAIAAVSLAAAAECEFIDDFYNGYTCKLSNAVVLAESDAFTITGTHLAGKSNADVEALFDGSNNQLTFIPPALTELLPNLEIIYLYSMGLQTLTPNSFTNCGSLRNLYIYGNNIESIAANVFNRCTRLRYLNLNQNGIQDVDEGAFTGLTRLQILDLSSNDIKSIQRNLLQSQVNLEELYLLGNQISAIESGAFRALANVQTIDLGENNLAALSADVFETSPYLEFLYLDNNQLTSVPQLSLASLKQLWLTANNIEGIDLNAFDGMMGIQVIDLKSNELTFFEAAPFERLNSLEQIFVENNKIESMDPNLFTRLPLLKTLAMVDNICVDENFYNMGDVEAVDIPELDRCFYHYIEPQKTYDCSFYYTTDYGYTCELNGIEFENFQDKFNISRTHVDGRADIEVSSLVILDSDLSRLPPILFEQFTGLIHVKVKGLHVIDADTFEVCPSLIYLDLSGNRIRQIPMEGFKNCDRKLSTINLNNNMITGVEPYANLLMTVVPTFLHMKNNICTSRDYADLQGLPPAWYSMYRCFSLWFLMHGIVDEADAH